MAAAGVSGRERGSAPPAALLLSPRPSVASRQLPALALRRPVGAPGHRAPVPPGAGAAAAAGCVCVSAGCVCVCVRAILGGVGVVSEPVRKNDSGVHHGVLPERRSQGSPADQRRDRAAAAPGQAGRPPGAEAAAAG